MRGWVESAREDLRTHRRLAAAAAEWAAVAQDMYASGKYTVSAIAKTLGVSRASIYRYLTTTS